MADTSKIVDPDNQAGTDYTSLSTWEAWAQGQGGAGDTNTAQCRCDSDGAATADAAVDLNGWTAGVKAKFTAMSGHHAGHKWDATKYRILGSGSSGIIIGRIPLTMEGIQAYSSSTSTTVPVLNLLTAATSVLLDGCYIAGACGRPVTVSLATAVITIRHSVLDGTSYSFYGSSYAEVYLYNCTLRGTYVQHKAGSTSVCTNCYVDRWYDPTAWTGSHNATAYSAGVGVDCKLNVTRTNELTDPDNATILSRDYSVKSTSTNLLDQGDDLTGTVPAVDIDGDARGATWDIGAAEYVAPAAGGCPKQFMYYESQRRLR